MTALPEIDLWVWSLTTENLSTTGSCHKALNAAERSRADRFVRAADRAAFIAAHVRMRQILSGYVGTAAGLLEFDSVMRSKPVLPNGPSFNLSHAGGYAVLAVAPGETEESLPLGVDIEKHRPVEPAVAEISFSQAEQKMLARFQGQDRTDAFFRCWTRKEAVVKATGLGLFAELGDFDVTFGPSEGPALTRAAGPFHAPEDWQLRHFELAPDLPGALACLTRGRDIRVTLRNAPEFARAVFRF